MRIAIASSGLGHVVRGIETWAEDTAVALAERAEVGGSLAVTLFAAGKVEGSPDVLDRKEERERSTFNAKRSTLKEAGSQRASDAGRWTERRKTNTTLPVVGFPCWRRSGRFARILARLSPSFTWRQGFKSAYGWEQFTFWRHLEPELRRGRFDILHVQDPMLAYWCRRARLKGRVKTQEILAHGTEETPAFRAAFECLQELTPWHLQELHRALGTSPRERPRWVSMPNFVDVDLFRPPRDEEERRQLRARIGVPDDAMVIGCVAALKFGHKRLDHLIEEVGKMAARREDVFLLLAGASTDETAAVEQLAAGTLRGRCRVLRDVSRSAMPDLYRAMDVFVLPSLFEMMPIAVLEAMASGLPVLVNEHPNLAWMLGKSREAGGLCVDMKDPDALARAVEALTPTQRREIASAGRNRAEEVFSRQVVIGQYVRYYKHVSGLEGE